jgi:two-component system nitrogen regulation response regulator GlnG
VLVVDDEALMRWSISQTLGALGCTVIEAADGQSALRLLADNPDGFDLILLDYQLPDSTDLDLAATLRQLSSRSQIVLMTAFGTTDTAREASAVGVDRVLTKPFELVELASLVDQAIRQRPH